MTKEELIKLSRENLRKSKQGSLCECYDEAFIKGYELSETCITELEKENAELKESNKMLEQGYVWHDYDAVEDCYEDTHEGKWVKRDEVYQLTKAKELIKKFSEFVNNGIEYDPEHPQEYTDLWNKLCAEAEQFLKDCEVEK